MTDRAPHAPTFSDIVVERSLDGIVAYDRDLRYTTWNGAMERLSGTSRDEAIGRSAFELFPFIRGTPYEELLLAPLEGRSATLHDEPSARRDDPRWVETHSAPLYDDAGAIIGGLCIVRDVTERHRLEEELRHSHKLDAVGRLAGGIAHDFNNLLTAIRGFTELFGQRTDDEDARRYAGEITKAADQAGDLVHHLLSFSLARCCGRRSSTSTP
jgi:PAS domain S-box-containing protein